MLCKQLSEGRDRNVEVILAILPLVFVDDGLVGQSLLAEIISDSERSIIARVCQAREGIVCPVVDELVSLVAEVKNVWFAGHWAFLMQQWGHFSLTTMRYRNNPDELGCVYA